MKDQYVILTGSKNNAGDFLIKYRAKQLFKQLRPDRDIIDFNGWEYLDDEKLKIVNASKALILTGGPALQKNMYPGIYKLRKNLDDIKVPIIMMGVGWKSMAGDWKDSYQYNFNKTSLELFKKVENSGYLSSVRDYQSLNSLIFNGFKNVLMTGCPAYYDTRKIGKKLDITDLKKVAFSVGVSFVDSPSMKKLMQENILFLKNNLHNIDFEVVFHHSLDKEEFFKHNSSSLKHFIKHTEFSQWLKSKNIKYIDISGSAEKLMHYYKSVDLHIGYRVHAHIFMNSVSKFSILISEDGRAKGVKGVIGGIVLDGYYGFKNNLRSKILNRLFSFYDRYEANKFLADEILYNIDYEKSINYIRIKNSRQIIDNNFSVMKKFIEQLP